MGADGLITQGATARWNRHVPGHLGQCHCWWCRGSMHRQAINTHDINKVVLMGVNGMAVQEGFQFQGTVHPAYVIMEHRDLFILYSQYHGCWWPGDASSHGLLKPEYSSTPAADAMAPCIARPSSPVILTMQDKGVVVIESFSWDPRTCLSCIVNILYADGLGTQGATAYWKLNFLVYLRLCHCC